MDSEEHTICHQVRDLIAFDLPRVSAAHDLVIVGGGMSGLTAAYLSPNLDWLLLEKEPDFGGNAYMMDFRGAAYGTGSAFVESPVAAEMAIQLGLKPLPIDNWDGSLIQGEYVPDTWGDGLDLLPYAPRVRENFKKFRQAMLAIDVEKRSRELDNTPFSKFLEGYAPEVKQWFDAYGPSNWARSARRPRRWWLLARSRRWAVKSAMMSAHLARRAGRCVRRLVDKLQAVEERMLTGATTLAVRPQRKEVHVSYMQGGRITTVAAKAVIMATPKFITAHIVEGLPESSAWPCREFAMRPIASSI